MTALDVIIAEIKSAQAKKGLLGGKSDFAEKVILFYSRLIHTVSQSRRVHLFSKKLIMFLWYFSFHVIGVDVLHIFFLVVSNPRIFKRPLTPYASFIATCCNVRCMATNSVQF